MKKVQLIVFSVLLVLMLGLAFYKEITLVTNCTGYLKRAANASTVEMAEKELGKSIQYLESNNLTEGYTSVLYKTPNDDIGFWYKNLKENHKELLKVDSTTSQLEKTNILMKLRETLLENNEHGDSLTKPNGLSRYPHNKMWAIITIFLFITGCIVIYNFVKEWYDNN